MNNLPTMLRQIADEFEADCSEAGVCRDAAAQLEQLLEACQAVIDDWDTPIEGSRHQHRHCVQRAAIEKVRSALGARA